MKDETLASLLVEAVGGSDIAREKIIRHYQPYIINTIGHISGRYVTWSDEEASVGLLAFNRAIDTYEANGGRTFLNYAYLLIKRDLIDYFRKERKDVHQLLQSSEEEKSSAGLIEVKRSMETYHQSIKKTDLIEEILEFSEILSQFGIEFEDLEKYTPKHRDTRKMLIEMANHFLSFSELIDELVKKKRIPVTAFIKRTRYSLKTIERHRNYLVMIIIVGLHPEWRQLSQYIQIPAGSGSV
jgi:RNA polymerase sigma factor